VEFVANQYLRNPINGVNVLVVDISSVFQLLLENVNFIGRCSITLITLSTPYSYTCRVCGKKMLDKEAFVKDREWCDKVFSESRPEMGDILPEIQKCIFCSGERIRKFL
jgi:hypothetical protein